MALKTVLVNGHEELSLLREEAEALKALNHPGVPKILDLAEDSHGSICIVRDYVDGRTLREIVRERRLEPRRAAKLIAELAETLDYVHGEGFLFRDLSRVNVLVDKDDRPYLTDFGIALSSTEPIEGEAALEVQIAGTRGYMPHESQVGELFNVDERSDVWARGAILYEVLTGSPFIESDTRLNASNDQEMVEARFRRFPDDVPVKLREICRCCTSNERNERYETAGLVAAELRRFLSGSTPDPMHFESVRIALNAWRLGKHFGAALHSDDAVRSGGESFEIPS